MGDPRRLFQAKDVEAACLYAKQVTNVAGEDASPLVIDANGYLLVNLTVGSVSIGGTISTTVTNGITVSSVSMTCSTTITGTVTTGVISATVSSISMTVSSISITASCTVINTLTVSSVSMTVSSVSMTCSTSVTGTVSTSVTGTVATSATLTSTFVTVGIISGQTAIAGGVGATAANVPRVVQANDVGRTLTTGTGSFTATNAAITLTPSNRAKIYAISLTTTSATELICIFNSGGVANGVELWRATLMAPAGANAGLNLAVTPPAYLFASRSGTSVSLSLNTATLIHYSVSYFDEI